MIHGSACTGCACACELTEIRATDLRFSVEASRASRHAAFGVAVDTPLTHDRRHCTCKWDSGRPRRVALAAPVGLGLGWVSAVFLEQLNANSSNWDLIWPLVIAGVGQGLFTSPN